MIIPYRDDPARRLAIAAYCPSAVAPYFDWSTGGWVQVWTPAQCLAVGAPCAAPFASILTISLPDAAITAETIVIECELDPSGNLIDWADLITVSP